MDNQPARFAEMAAAVARRAAPQPGRFSHPACSPASLLAVLLLREQLRLTCRGLEDLLRLCRPRLLRAHSSRESNANDFRKPDIAQAAT